MLAEAIPAAAAWTVADLSRILNLDIPQETL
jgi:hypothetical protein